MTAMSRKRSPGFSGKNSGVTPSVAAPGVTHPSDATVMTRHVMHNGGSIHFDGEAARLTWFCFVSGDESISGIPTGHGNWNAPG